MFELKLGFTLCVVCYIIVKIVEALFTDKSRVLVTFSMYSDKDYPWKQLLLLAACVIGFLTGIVFVLVGAWKVL